MTFRCPPQPPGTLEFLLDFALEMVQPLLPVVFCYVALPTVGYVSRKARHAFYNLWNNTKKILQKEPDKQFKFNWNFNRNNCNKTLPVKKVALSRSLISTKTGGSTKQEFNNIQKLLRKLKGSRESRQTKVNVLDDMTMFDLNLNIDNQPSRKVPVNNVVSSRSVPCNIPNYLGNTGCCPKHHFIKIPKFLGGSKNSCESGRRKISVDMASNDESLNQNKNFRSAKNGYLRSREENPWTSRSYTSNYVYTEGSGYYYSPAPTNSSILQSNDHVDDVSQQPKGKCQESQSAGKNRPKFFRIHPKVPCDKNGKNHVFMLDNALTMSVISFSNPDLSTSSYIHNAQPKPNTLNKDPQASIPRKTDNQKMSICKPSTALELEMRKTQIRKIIRSVTPNEKKLSKDGPYQAGKNSNPKVTKFRCSNVQQSTLKPLRQNEQQTKSSKQDDSRLKSIQEDRACPKIPLKSPTTIENYYKAVTNRSSNKTPIPNNNGSAEPRREPVIFALSSVSSRSPPSPKSIISKGSNQSEIGTSDNTTVYFSAPIQKLTEKNTASKTYKSKEPSSSKKQDKGTIATTGNTSQKQTTEKQELPLNQKELKVAFQSMDSTTDANQNNDHTDYPYSDQKMRYSKYHDTYRYTRTPHYYHEDYEYTRTPDYQNDRTVYTRTPDYQNDNYVYTRTPEYQTDNYVNTRTPEYQNDNYVNTRTPKYQNDNYVNTRTPKYQYDNYVYTRTPEYQYDDNNETISYQETQNYSQLPRPSRSPKKPLSTSPTLSQSNSVNHNSSLITTAPTISQSMSTTAATKSQSMSTTVDAVSNTNHKQLSDPDTDDVEF